MSAEKILVRSSTGKVGRNVCPALLEAGFEVYGATRSPRKARSLLDFAVLRLL